MLNKIKEFAIWSFYFANFILIIPALLFLIYSF